MNRAAWVRPALLIGAIANILIAAPALSQESTGVELPAEVTIDGTTGAPVQPTPKPKAKVAVKSAAAPAKPAETGEMRQRLDQLEGQVSDLQVVVGTFQSLTKGRPSNAGAATADGSVGADIDGRVRDLETRMGQLSTQMSEVSQQLRQLNGQLGGKALPAAPLAAGAETLVNADASAATGEEGGFGKTEVLKADGSDPIAQALQADGNAAPLVADAAPQLASVDPAAMTPQQTYEGAYGQLLQQDYAGAEQGFRRFLAQYPGDQLASDAQYFLGETHYVRGQYKPAAEAYLKGYSTFRQARRAPDSLLKLAMSLSRLNQKESSCNAFVALDSEYPNAPAQVKRRAISERERIGC
jgi:tol-pal system protein YbgF